MGKFNGFGGMGGGNMQQMMKQAQEMQKQIEKTKQELGETAVEAASGGGMVTVEITGMYELINLKIKPEAVDSDDIEMLEDLIIAAINEALNQVTQLREEKLPL
jgi:DNA-binding YbaB/EbfC family protein